MPPYPAWRDRVYRYSLAAATVALGALGAGRAGVGPSLAAWAGVLLAAATLAAGWSFLVWVAAVRRVVLALAVTGTVLLPVAPPWGTGVLLAALSVMAAKETHCFRFPAGRVIPWVSLVVALAGLIPAGAQASGVGLLVVAGLWATLVVQRWRLPLFEI
jgi:uncharacterized integral membrane protein